MNPSQLFKRAFSTFSGFLALASATLIIHSAQAAVSLPWYEPFAYSLGQNLGGTNVSSAVWNIGATSGVGSPSIYPVDNLSYSGLLTTPSSGGLVMGLLGKSRSSGASFTGAGSNIYGSFLINVQTYPVSTSDSLFFALSTESSGSSVGSSATGLWLSPSGQLKLGVDTEVATGDSAGTSTVILSTNVTHLIVMSYTNKTLSVWLDPSPSTFGAPESSVPAYNTTASNSNGKATTAMMSLWIIHDSSKYTNFITELDEIRLGSTWASVTPAGIPSAATSISFTTQPGYAGVGASVGTVVAQILDQYGNPFPSSGVPITLSLSGSGSLGGTVTQNTDGTGKATFSGISVSAPGVDQLVANGGSLPAGTSDYFSVLSTSGGGGSVPVISHISKSGGSVAINGSNGQASQPFTVLASGSLTTPRSSWSQIDTSHSFDGSGNFSVSEPTNGSQQYYAINYNGSGGGPLTLPNFVSTGFASTNNVTGGAGGPTVTVSNYSDFTNYLLYPAPLIVRVAGTITDPYAGTVSNDYAYIEHEDGADDKTIIGVGTNATLVGVDLRPHATNIIIRNLFFSVLPGGTNDAITLDGGSDGTNGYTWIDHCDFYDAQDGSCDITKGADYVTLSWDHFHYQSIGNPKPFHRLVDLIGSSDTDSGVNFHVTFHHDWYDTNCMERMPSVRFGHVHIFNNYYACPGNDYCVRTRISAQVQVESTYFNSVNDPFEYYVNTNEPVHGLLKQFNNIAVNCTTNYGYILLDDTNHIDIPGGQPPNTIISSNADYIEFYQNASSGTPFILSNNLTGDHLGSDTLTSPDFNPLPYSYNPDPVANVPNIVTNYSGAGVLLPLP